MEKDFIFWAIFIFTLCLAKIHFWCFVAFLISEDWKSYIVVNFVVWKVRLGIKQLNEESNKEYRKEFLLQQ